MERRFGRLAIENLTLLIVGGMAAVFVLTLLRPSFEDALTLDLAQVRRGQVWRLVTYLFLPPTHSIVWAIFGLYWLWMVGSALENEWGSFKFNAYYLVGMIGTTVAAWATGSAESNSYLNLSLFFAFATLFPDYQLLLFFVLPVRVKWLALLSAIGLVAGFVLGSWATRGAILAALSNYFLFFSGTLVARLRQRNQAVRQAARRESFRPPPTLMDTSQAAGQAMGARSCAICGVKEVDGADIRVCTCEKCGGSPRNLCLEHARNH